ncbi:RimJ/RimL family protein N-acetyltransferase [Metabacillus crassostreae]|uniref:GNAT family N-acetyltransferase n=1 Tax=Metabacillus crassostreae TaxID=929098 RepID=UPI00195C3104|nr:GNAT family N-acetyltransferase [Metabacillus crassostreae]MBM7602928.1 RimJ/RimL family protein N-acetyltransferase [Metabacillus crassostreae]
MDHNKEVTLTHFSTEHLDHLNSFQLPTEQEKFTALPKNAIEVTRNQYRMVLLSNEKPVGYFLLHSTERVMEYTDNPHAMLLTAFSINYPYQGKGIAKKGMLLLEDFVKKEFSTCNEIILAVNHKNIPAQKLYAKVGFQDTGRRKVGLIGEQFIMSLEINEDLS